MSDLQRAISLREQSDKMLREELHRKDRRIARLQHQLRIANMNSALMVKAAAEVAGVTPQTIWNWKREGLPQTESGKVWYSDLIRFLADKDPVRCGELGFDPEIIREAL